MKNRKAIDQESNGVDQRGFIAKTIFAVAGLAVLAASQNEVSAQTAGQRSGREARGGSFAGTKKTGQAGSIIGRTGSREHHE